MDEIHIIQSRLCSTELVTQANLFVVTVAILQAVTTTNISVPVLSQSKSQTSLSSVIEINELNTNDTMEVRHVLYMYQWL